MRNPFDKLLAAIRAFPWLPSGALASVYAPDFYQADAFSIPRKPMTKAEKLADIVRRRNLIKDQIATAIKQKKPRLHLRNQLAALTGEELRIEGER